MFLPTLPRVIRRNVKSKSRTRTKCLLVSLWSRRSYASALQNDTNVGTETLETGCCELYGVSAQAGLRSFRDSLDLRLALRDNGPRWSAPLGIQCAYLRLRTCRHDRDDRTAFSQHIRRACH